jgi:two-component system OmpR family sensor kinase
LNGNRFALKDASVYTFLIAMILVAPLYVYVVYMKSLHDIQTELQMKRQASLIIRAMEEFDAEHEEYFAYPRFKSFQSGLYDSHFQPVFSLITEPLHVFMPGYHVDDGTAFLILALPEKRYFDARYLVLNQPLSYVVIYEKAAMILLSIVILVFGLSLFFLNRFAQPFKRVNEQLDNFIKDSMHEINTPLSIINVNVDLYNRKHPRSKYMQRIKAAAKTLSNIYNDMDYLIKKERVEMAAETIDLSAFVRERIDYFTEVAAMKKVEIVSVIDEGVKITFNTVQLQRVVDNNLSNAIKYSHEESVIEVRLLRRKVGGCTLTFKDYGIGIEDTAQIFERYYREDRDKGGFGLGLNIVKAIIDRAGIALDVESEYGRGSSFTYTFPATMTAK